MTLLKFTNLKSYWILFFFCACTALQAQQGFPSHVGQVLSMPNDKTLALMAYKMSFTDEGEEFWSNYVQVYTREGEDWKPKGQALSLPDAQASVARIQAQMPNANTLVLGMSCSLMFSAYCQGWVQVYVWKDGVWQAKGPAFEQPGLSTSGDYTAFMPNANTLAIGDWAENAEKNRAGLVRVYAWDGQKWLQKGQDLRGQGAMNAFGFSLEMPDAQTIAVGAYLADDYRGCVQVYAWNGRAWVEKGERILGKMAKAQAGYTLAMPNAHTLALSMTHHEENPPVGFGNGLVQVYEWKGKAWVQKGQDLGKDADARCGHALAMPNANTIAFTCPDKDLDEKGVMDLGVARVYAWDGKAWQAKGQELWGERASACLGQSLVMPSAGYMVLGQVDNCGIGKYDGKLIFYVWKNGQWLKVGK